MTRTICDTCRYTFVVKRTARALHHHDSIFRFCRNSVFVTTPVVHLDTFGMKKYFNICTHNVFIKISVGYKWVYDWCFTLWAYVIKILVYTWTVYLSNQDPTRPLYTHLNTRLNLTVSWTKLFLAVMSNVSLPFESFNRLNESNGRIWYCDIFPLMNITKFAEET